MRFYATLVLAVCAVPLSASAGPLIHVRIDAEDARAVAARLESAGFDVLEGSVTETTVELIVSESELTVLERQGYALVTLARGRPFAEIQAERRGPRLPPGYPTLAEMIDAMDTAATSFPAICEMVDLTLTYGTPPTFEGRHLFAVKISDNVAQDEDEPAFLLVSNHHAREVVTPVIALDTISRLTTQYGTDPSITRIVDDNEIWIAPTWNPDGYEYMYFVDNMWRKNRRVFTGAVGVDLNRNYPFGWSSACAGSTVPSSNTYKGPDPASEPETQTMIAFSHDRHFCKVLDFHSSGRETLYGYACHSHPFVSFLLSEAITLSTASGYGGSHRSPSAEGEHYEWQLAMMGGHAFLTETHTEFQPSYESAQAEAALVWPGTRWLLRRVIPLSGHVTDATTGDPIVASITYAGVNFPNGEQNASESRFGRYHAFLPPGSYTVEFSAPGYVPQSHVVTVNFPEVIEVTLDPCGLGDLDCDGAVDLTDFAVFAGCMNGPESSTPPPGCDPGDFTNADLDDDDNVDLADFGVFQFVFDGVAGF